MMISVRQTGHPAAISDTRMAHGSHKRACLHSTNAKPARGATRHTSQQSAEVDAADDSDAVNGQFSDFYSAVIIRPGLSSPSVQPLFDLVLKLHGLAMSGLAISASPERSYHSVVFLRLFCLRVKSLYTAQTDREARFPLGHFPLLFQCIGRFPFRPVRTY